MTTVAGTAAGGFAWKKQQENEELKESNTSHQAQQTYMTTTCYVAVCFINEHASDCVWPGFFSFQMIRE